MSGLDEAVIKNVEACKQLSKITRTSLGPNGTVPHDDGRGQISPEKQTVANRRSTLCENSKPFQFCHEHTAGPPVSKVGRRVCLPDVARFHPPSSIQLVSGSIPDPTHPGKTSPHITGMNKMVINHLDRLFVTSDAAVIVRELEVAHPAAKLLVMAAQAQEQEIGDGTNLVVRVARFPNPDTLFAGCPE
jgi:hypothetical protein|tara:strand:+ start:547 stop:1113 length:567 start_codon:yes stop_codon:yes gene_type:complete